MTMPTWIMIVMIGALSTACVATRPALPEAILPAPGSTTSQAAPLMAEGTHHFIAGDWPRAVQAFQQATETQPELAEAHYNLAVALDHQGQSAKAKQHYILAANLAPGNKIMWDAPPFRNAVQQKPLLRNPPLLKNNPGVTF